MRRSRKSASQGSTDPVKGEVVKAWVVLRTDQTATEAELRAYLPRASGRLQSAGNDRISFRAAENDGRQSAAARAQERRVAPERESLRSSARSGASRGWGPGERSDDVTQVLSPILLLALLVASGRAEADKYQVYAVRFATITRFLRGEPRGRRRSDAPSRHRDDGLGAEGRGRTSGARRFRLLPRTLFQAVRGHRLREAVGGNRAARAETGRCHRHFPVAHALGSCRRHRVVPVGARMGSESRVRVLHRRGVAGAQHARRNRSGRRARDRQAQHARAR